MFCLCLVSVSFVISFLNFDVLLLGFHQLTNSLQFLHEQVWETLT